MLRYLFDEHALGVVAVQPRLRGIDVLTTQAAGLANQSIQDDVVLRYAANAGRVLVTQDRDFIAWPTGCGLMRVRSFCRSG